MCDLDNNTDEPICVFSKKPITIIGIKTVYCDDYCSNANNLEETYSNYFIKLN